MLDYELGHFHTACELMKHHERRDPQEIFPDKLPDPFPYQSNREFVREVLTREVSLRANGTEFVPESQESKASLAYREHMNSEGSPTEIVAAGYRWLPGTELTRKVVNL
jgi:hypothetical protein